METAVRSEIIRFVSDAAGNRYPDSAANHFDEPLVGYAAASDPLFAEYKHIIGPFHQTPAEIVAGAGSVVVWILPIGAPARESNRRETVYPSREWALTRDHGEKLNVALRRHMTAWLQEHGWQAVAPQLAESWRQVQDGPCGIASTWSERHAAYAAGLGTFSLNDGLITQRGIAHRCGSVITDLVLAPSPRPYDDPRQNCLYHRERNCGRCIDRCPVGALSIDGHDKEICSRYVYEAAVDAVAGKYGVAQTGCGLCQSGVPCESRIPLPGKLPPR